MFCCDGGKCCTAGPCMIRCAGLADVWKRLADWLRLFTTPVLLTQVVTSLRPTAKVDSILLSVNKTECMSLYISSIIKTKQNKLQKQSK